MEYQAVASCYSHYGARGAQCVRCEYAEYCKRARDEEKKLMNNSRKLNDAEFLSAHKQEGGGEKEKFLLAFQAVARFFLSLEYREFLALQIHFKHPSWGWRRIAKEITRRETLFSWFSEQKKSVSREEVLRILNLLRKMKG